MPSSRRSSRWAASHVLPCSSRRDSPDAQGLVSELRAREASDAERLAELHGRLQEAEHRGREAAEQLETERDGERRVIRAHARL